MDKAELKEKRPLDFTEEELRKARQDLMNEEGFLEDPRYRQCNKEARYGMILGAITLLIWAIAGYGLGSGKVEDYSYFMGFPLWFFISCIVAPIITIIGTFMISRRIQDTPLDRMTEEEAVLYHAERLRKDNE